MNARRAKQEACDIVAALIDQYMRDNDDSHGIDDEADIGRIDNALRDLAKEMARRGAPDSERTS